MVRDNIEIDLAELVDWAHQAQLLGPDQVAKVDNPRLAELQNKAERTGILRCINRTGGRGLAIWIGLAGSRQGSVDQLAVCADDGEGGLAEMDLFARMRHHMVRVRTGQQRLIPFISLLGWRIRCLPVRSVIDEGSDRNSLRQSGNSADVIYMVMRDQQIVDAMEASLFRRSKDAIGALPVVGPSRIDQQRPLGRGDKQSGLAAFDVDEVDGQRRFDPRRTRAEGGVLGRGWNQPRTDCEQHCQSEGCTEDAEIAAPAFSGCSAIFHRMRTPLS